MNFIKKLITVVPNTHNWLSDRDFIWWPFSFLRPSPETTMSFGHTLLMTACFGGLSFLMFVGFAVVNNMFTASSAVNTFMICFGGFLVWFNLVTKPFWNYRARQLQKSK
ncbi:MAG: hypothetical protein H0V66_05815 [Bdellovibrionales bacterium]|nr:hypothetical protein [Bdellovibrionales bacterium]